MEKVDPPVETLAELDDLEYLVELSEAMNEEDLGIMAIAVAGFLVDKIRKEARRDC